MCQNLKADFDSIALHEMIIKSDKIIYGEIADMDSTHFTLNISGSVTGEIGKAKIRKFRNWTCATRWTKYELGQRLLLFLGENNGELFSMGAANEGELPLDNNSVFINALSMMYVNGDQNDYMNTEFTFDSKEYELYGADYFGTKINLNSFLRTVAYVRKCFNFEYGKYYQVSSWSYSCEMNEIKYKAESSLLLNSILREATERKNER